MMKYTKLMIAALPVMAFALTGCQKTKKVFGMTKNPPNEFTVMQRAPLEVPPNYNLRPPRPGVKRPQETDQLSADQKAKQALTSKKKPVNKAGLSRSENHLLTKAGAENVDGTIRETVDTEAYVANHRHDEKNWLRKNLPFYKAPKDRNLLDPKKEAERLQAEQEKRS